MIEIVNPVTGEIQELKEPQSLDEANEQLAVLRAGLSAVSKQLFERRRALSDLETEYIEREATLLAASEYPEAGQRKADVIRHLFAGGAESLGARKKSLETDVRILQERSHNYRAAMNSLQTTSANLRAESNLRGDTWPGG